MVELLQVQVKHPGTALTDKELKLIDCLIMRICAHHLHRRLARPFRIRPSNVDSIHLLVNQTISVDGGMTEEEHDIVVQDMTEDILNTLSMCDLSTEEVILTAKA